MYKVSDVNIAQHIGLDDVGENDIGENVEQ